MPTLTTAHLIHSLTTAEAHRQYPVHPRAVVTYIDLHIVPTMPLVFVCDPTGCVFLSTSPPLPALHAGTLVDVQGVSGPGDYAPVVNRALVRIVGDSHLLPSPHRASRNEIMTGQGDAQWVEAEGVVRSIVQSENNVTLDLLTIDGKITATTTKKPGVDYKRLLGAKIALRGNVAIFLSKKLLPANGVPELSVSASCFVRRKK